jgi:hypothetical protein
MGSGTKISRDSLMISLAYFNFQKSKQNMLKKGIGEKGWGDIDYIDLVHDTDQW